jgi:hypothetical protein
LEAQLTAERIRYWRDVHNLVAGCMDSQIDRAIGLNPTVILILSKNSIDSDWVM